MFRRLKAWLRRRRAKKDLQTWVRGYRWAKEELTVHKRDPNEVERDIHNGRCFDVTPFDYGAETYLRYYRAKCA